MLVVANGITKRAIRVILNTGESHCSIDEDILDTWTHVPTFIWGCICVWRDRCKFIFIWIIILPEYNYDFQVPWKYYFLLLLLQYFDSKMYKWSSGFEEGGEETAGGAGGGRVTAVILVRVCEPSGGGGGEGAGGGRGWVTGHYENMPIQI